MNASFARKTALVAAVACVGAADVTAQNSSPLQLNARIELPGVQGRIDHLAFDAAGQRLFLCALGNNTVEVVDLRKGKQIHSIVGLSAPQGIACIPELSRIFVANDKGGVCKLYDANSFQELKELDLQDDADNVRYDAATKKIFVGYGNGGIAVIDAEDGKRIGSIKLPAHPEAFALEQHGNRMFVNIPGTREVAVIDREKGEVAIKWQIGFAFENFPMALDESNHRLFVGCRLPPKLVVLNTESGDAVAKIDISGDADEVFYDSKRRRIYAICGAGRIDIILQNDPNSYVLATTIETADGARTGLFVPERDALFVAVPHRGSQRAEVREYKIK